MSDFSKESAAYYVDIFDKDDHCVDAWQIQKGVFVKSILERIHNVLQNRDDAVKIVIRKV